MPSSDVSPSCESSCCVMIQVKEPQRRWKFLVVTDGTQQGFHATSVRTLRDLWLLFDRGHYQPVIFNVHFYFLRLTCHWAPKGFITA